MRRLARYQIFVHLAALIPLAWLIYDALAGNLSVNPIQDVEQRTGRYALMLLTASLSCTPLQILTGWPPLLRWRRPLGLYAFGYALLHFLTFIGLDYGFSFEAIWADVAGKRYIFVGAAALVILLLLAGTSTDGWKRRLGKAWKRLHRWAYAAGALVIVHYIWAAKTDQQAIAWGVVIGLGFVLRLPPVRRAVVRARSQRARPVAAAPGSRRGEVTRRT
jgi:methionine sulfoxide reductase heme-binding subunit